jgi:hypothetical protein
MERLLFLKRAPVVSYAVFGSTSCSEPAENLILCILGLIASVLVMTPECPASEIAGFPIHRRQEMPVTVRL